ncbi:transposase [Streptomyces sp. NBC_01707]|uniref:transposase n=1 Tax=Streptomyces sp. NBC_01707 TaxID=2975914 RepID=UPI00352EE094
MDRYHLTLSIGARAVMRGWWVHRGKAPRDRRGREQVIADAKNGPLAHLPSGNFQANAAWLALAALTQNLMRAMGTLASAFHAKATTATIRAQPIAVPAQIARGARRLMLHLPTNWPWQDVSLAVWCRCSYSLGLTPGSHSSPPCMPHPTAAAPSDPPERARDLWTCGKAGQTSDYPTPTASRRTLNDHSDIKPVDPG